jgi:hypothetical protein
MNGRGQGDSIYSSLKESPYRLKGTPVMTTPEAAAEALAATYIDVREALTAQGYAALSLDSPADLRAALGQMEADGQRLFERARSLAGTLTAAEEREATAGPRL